MLEETQASAAPAHGHGRREEGGPDDAARDAGALAVLQPLADLQPLLQPLAEAAAWPAAAFPRRGRGTYVKIRYKFRKLDAIIFFSPREASMKLDKREKKNENRKMKTPVFFSNVMSKFKWKN